MVMVDAGPPLSELILGEHSIGRLSREGHSTTVSAQYPTCPLE
jgi:hypothetical protein